MGKKIETMTEFIFSGSKITADDISQEIKRHLRLGRKAMTNIESILKNRDVTLLTKVYLVKAMVFPVVMYRGESWTIKKAEHQRTDAFELWCWKRLLRKQSTSPFSQVHTEPSPEQITSWAINLVLVNSKKLKSLQSSFLTTVQ